MSQLDTLKVKHASITSLDYVFINATDFDPDIHTMFVEPGSESPVESKPDETTSTTESEAQTPAEPAPAEPAPAETTETEKIQEEETEDQETEPAPSTARKRRNTPTA